MEVIFNASSNFKGPSEAEWQGCPHYKWLQKISKHASTTCSIPAHSYYISNYEKIHSTLFLRPRELCSGPLGQRELAMEMLQSMGSKRVRHNLATQQQQHVSSPTVCTNLASYLTFLKSISSSLKQKYE